MLGAYWASRVGPAVEAQLSRHQAARQGSDCGCNIDRVFRHLDPLGDGGEAGDIEDQLWSDVLGPAAPGVAELCDGVGDCGLDDVPAVTLADQEKAFERMGLEWRRRVMMAWRIPRWATSVGDALAQDRAVRAMLESRVGPEMRLRRSLGMGGTSSMLEWNMGYDPIVDAVGGPVFVDDLAGLTRGPRRTLRMQYFLLAAGQAAGLRVATHTCAEISATSVDERARRALARLPTQSAWQGGRW